MSFSCHYLTVSCGSIIYTGFFSQKALTKANPAVFIMEQIQHTKSQTCTHAVFYLTLNNETKACAQQTVWMEGGWGVFSALSSGVSSHYRLEAGMMRPGKQIYLLCLSVMEMHSRSQHGRLNIADSLELTRHTSRLYGWLVFYGLHGSCHHSS